MDIRVRGLYVDFNRSAVVVVFVVVNDRILIFDGCATFTFRSRALSPPRTPFRVTPPRTGMTRRIVLFERENTTTRKLLLTRSRATIRVFAGFSISFYLVTLSLRRRVEVRVTERRGEEDATGAGGRSATRDTSQKFPRRKLFASNNFKGGTSFLRNDCTKLRRLRWK